MNRSVDELDAWACLLIAIAVLGILLGIGLLIYLAITGEIAIVAYKKFYLEAEREYRDLDDELTGGVSTDSALRAVFGDGFDLPKDGAGNTVDWFSETLFGKERDREA